MPVPSRSLPLAGLLLVAALAIRAVQFGNPVLHVDEQYYLLVGDRIWHGAWPYSEYWDRKPVGLFLIYAAIRALPGDGVLAYQIVATFFAAATAFVIQRIAARIAPAGAATGAALLYLVMLMANGGDGGQSPVFYNLPVAVAAWCVLHGVERGRVFAFGCVAMALFGLALQIKYSALFEGVYFGVVLLLLVRGGGVGRRAAMAAAWIALALAPTVVALLVYLAAGRGDAFVFANFISVFQRPPSVDGDAPGRLARIAVHVLPLAIPAAIALARPGRWQGAPVERRIIAGWLIAAVAGVIVFGTYHDHYALPLLVPLAVVAAPVLAVRRLGPVIGIGAALAGGVMATTTIADRRAMRGTGAHVRAIAERVGPCSDCLYVFSGDPVLYLLTGATPPTRWVFPTFLSETRDTGSLGFDVRDELRRILAAAPRYVVTRDYPFAEADPAAWRVMQAGLSAHYRPVLAQRVGRRTILLYERQSRSTAPKP